MVWTENGNQDKASKIEDMRYITKQALENGSAFPEVELRVLILLCVIQHLKSSVISLSARV